MSYINEPTIIANGRNLTLDSHLLENGIIMLTTEFEPTMSASIVKQLLYLDTVDTDEPIRLYINSPGGCVMSALAIYDTMRRIKRKVNTIALGMAASAGALILCAGEKGMRQALRNTQIMFHEISTGHQGRFSDIEVSYKHSEYLNDKLHKIIAQHTGQSVAKIKKMFEKDIWMKPKDAVAFGAIDEVLD